MTDVPAAAEPSIEPEPIDSPQSRQLLARYVAELGERFPTGFDVNQAAPPEPGDFTPPAGVFLLVRVEGRALGCGAVRTEYESEDRIGEIRRMWIAPELRGRGAGRELLRALEEWARGSGCRAVRLDTAGELHEARALYVADGYREIAAYNWNPYAQHWFEKTLN